MNKILKLTVFVKYVSLVATGEKEDKKEPKGTERKRESMVDKITMSVEKEE